MGTPLHHETSRINFQYKPDLLCHNYCHIFSYFILHTKQSCEETDEDKQVVGVLCLKPVLNWANVYIFT